jgi:hypothetical protein
VFANEYQAGVMNEQEQVSAEQKVPERDYKLMWECASLRIIKLEDEVAFWRGVAQINSDTIKDMVSARNGSTH